MTPAEVRAWAKDVRERAKRLAEEAEAMQRAAFEIQQENIAMRERMRRQFGRRFANPS
jgi:hypothetical protein